MRIEWYRVSASKSLSPVTITSAPTATAVADDVVVIGIAADAANLGQRYPIGI